MCERNDDFEGEVGFTNGECLDFENIMDRFQGLAHDWLFINLSELNVFIPEVVFTLESNYKIVLDENQTEKNYQKILIQFEISPVQLYSTN